MLERSLTLSSTRHLEPWQRLTAAVLRQAIRSAVHEARRRLPRNAPIARVGAIAAAELETDESFRTWCLHAGLDPARVLAIVRAEAPLPVEGCD